MNPLLPHLQTLAARATPTQIALRDGRRALRYHDLPAAVAKLADWLRAQQCQVVALQLPNSVDWVLLDLACQAAGVICLPLPDFFSDGQIAHCLHSASADLLVTKTEAETEVAGGKPIPGLTGLYAQLLQTQHSLLRSWPDGTSKITFTSGSTGTPKGVCLDADLQWRVARSLADAIGLDRMRHLCLLPLATLLENIAGVYAPLLCGGEVVIPDASTRGLSGSSGLDLAAMLRCLQTEQPNTLILLPQLLRALLVGCAQGWQAPASLQFVAVGGARVAPELIGAARRVGLPVYEGYGLSECGSVVALNTFADDQPGSVGRVLPHCQVAIEDGEIVVRGACHLGYLGVPASWYPQRIASGDLGFMKDGDSTGDSDHLFVNGRRKNLLITAFGRNVSPEWVESELGARPLLTQCVVIGDARPYLAALLSAPAQIDDDAIQRWIDSVNGRLPDYARVRRWLRLQPAAWQPLLTENGRPRRDRIVTELGAQIDVLYDESAVGNNPDLSIPTESRATL